jgi:hypothetical protein
VRSNTREKQVKEKRDIHTQRDNEKQEKKRKRKEKSKTHKII